METPHGFTVPARCKYCGQAIRPVKKGRTDTGYEHTNGKYHCYPETDFLLTKYDNPEVATL